MSDKGKKQVKNNIHDEDTWLQRSKDNVRQFKKGRQRVLNEPSNLKAIIEAYLSIQLVQQIQNNNTRQCNYAIFHAPFTYLLCDAIQILKPSDSSLQIILKQTLKKLNALNKSSPQQLPSEEMMNLIVDGLNLAKQPAGYFQQKLKNFLQKYRAKMSTFIPYYFYMFQMIANRQQFLTHETTISDLNKIFSDKKSWIRAKYHNDSLQ